MRGRIMNADYGLNERAVNWIKRMKSFTSASRSPKSSATKRRSRTIEDTAGRHRPPVRSHQRRCARFQMAPGVPSPLACLQPLVRARRYPFAPDLFHEPQGIAEIYAETTAFLRSHRGDGRRRGSRRPLPLHVVPALLCGRMLAGDLDRCGAVAHSQLRLQPAPSPRNLACVALQR